MNTVQKFDVVALDEGHKIKNSSTKTFRSINAIRSDFRLLLTGTAVQNNLLEMWSFFDFVQQGGLLGSYHTFVAEYERPITESRKKDVNAETKALGNSIALRLKNLVRPYMLRRTKDELNLEAASDDGEQLHRLMPKLEHKNELVLWVRLSETQIRCYRRFLESLLTRSDKRSPLMELNIIKKICDHPRLMSREHCMEMGLSDSSVKEMDTEQLLVESGKTEVLAHLLHKLTVEEGRKCLVFSQSKIVLNVAQRILASKKFQVPSLRLDGDVINIRERQRLVDTFNDPNNRFRVMLLTSQVGGVGLTLTAADRVIIYDLSWNPATDAQSIDRVYRIGQTKHVVVYRLVTCASVEEKIYRRQIFKERLNRQTTGIDKKVDDNPYRYFTNSELLDLFKLDGDPRYSDTQQQLEKQHSHQRKSQAGLMEHIKWLEGLESVAGISDHDLMFSQADNADILDAERLAQIEKVTRNAEGKLQNDASGRTTEEEIEMRRTMGLMSLNDVKRRDKPHAPSLSSSITSSNTDMFVPTTVRRPIDKALSLSNVDDITI